MTAPTASAADRGSALETRDGDGSGFAAGADPRVEPSPPLPPGRLYLDGAWCEGVGGRSRDVVNPATAKVVTVVAEADASDVDTAVTVARRAFDDGRWSHLAPRARARVLSRMAGLVRAHTAELALLETIDTGKPRLLSEYVDVASVAELFEYYAALAWSLDGATRSTGAPLFAYTVLEPVGVVAAISPFNFPLVLSASKIAPALAAGNTVIHKPSEDTPLTALRIAELFTEAGGPPGVLNVVTGPGEVGARLVRHPGVDLVAFTGSTAVGRQVAAAAAETLKRVTVELGGKSAQVVFADADVEATVASAVQGFVFNTGQFCAAGSRLLVERARYGEVLERIVAAADAVPVGDPLLPTTAVGPLSGPRHLAAVESALVRGLAEHGRVLVGGARLASHPGYFFAPTVVTDLPQDSTLIQEEIFGPVLTVQAFDGEEEAIALANGTRYGLAAGLYTRDLGRAHRVARRLRAGTVWVNTWGVLDCTMPFGGVRQSGYGRENGPEGLQGYTSAKSVLMAV